MISKKILPSIRSLPHAYVELEDIENQSSGCTMPKVPSQMFTYQARLPSNASHDSILDDFSTLMNLVERNIHKDVCSGKSARNLKNSYLVRYLITARQFNSCCIQYEGKASSIIERRKGLIAECKTRIESLEKRVKKLEKYKKKSNALHQKKRKLATLTQKLNTLIQKAKDEEVSLCFGSKKLFLAQYHLKENGYASHEEWCKAWKDDRNNSFLLVGSKDEASGNQSCTAILQEDGNITLRLRLPDALTKKHGKYLVIPNIRFPYGHEVIVQNINDCEERNRLFKEKNVLYKQHGEAITFRFKRDKKGWIVFASTSLQEPNWITNKKLGAIGVDINEDHLAVTETDRFGNPITHKRISLHCYGKSTSQAKALIHEAVKQVVDLAVTSQKPIVLEKLDFQEKKATLQEQSSPKLARMLSSLAYNAIKSSFKSCGWRFGVRIEEINPAYTSVIGRVNFATRYGLSVHEAAALCIARRFLEISERLPCTQVMIPDGKGAHVAFIPPVRMEHKHVCVTWRQIKKKISVVLAAHFQAKRSSSGPPFV